MLRTIIHDVSPGQIYERCIVGVPLWQRFLLALPMACAEPDLNRGVCNVWVTETTDKWVLDHELAHCQGYDHNSGMRAYFNMWKQKGR